jgi:hypothetical protein
VDHLHPDSGIALATAADGEALTRDCFGDRVLWVPWRRPGFQLGLDIATAARDNPGAIGVILGVNGIYPDAVVRGSGIFAGGWGAQRAAVYGVREGELGAYYAQRTLLKREVLPEHVAAAVVALTAGNLALTTGLHIPVDAGVAAAFLR